jgi:hypothetical protein
VWFPGEGIGGDMKKYANLRYLDFDDLILLTILYDGGTYKDCCAALQLTPPAISHRLRKIEGAIPGFSTKVTKGKRNFSNEAIDFAMKAKKILSLWG